MSYQVHCHTGISRSGISGTQTDTHDRTRWVPGPRSASPGMTILGIETGKPVR